MPNLATMPDLQVPLGAPREPVQVDGWQLRLRDFAHARVDLDEPTLLDAGGMREAPVLVVVHAGTLTLRLPERGATSRLLPGDVVLLTGDTSWQLSFGDGSQARVLELEAPRPLVPRPPPPPSPRLGPRAELSLIVLGFDDDARLDLLEGLPSCLRREAAHAGAPFVATALAGLDGAGASLFDDPAIFARVLEIMVLELVRQSPRTDDRRARVSTPIRRSIDLMRRELAASWRVATLGARVGLSRSVYASRFTTEVGEPPLHFLAKLRLRAAADRLLRHRDEPIKSVAATVGYDSMPSFCKAFKNQFGIAPGRYRSRSGS
jgi:AraC-like DNA-binding protein